MPTMDSRPMLKEIGKGRMIGIGVDYYPEQWDRALWEDDVRRMSELGVKVVRIGEFAWSRMEPREGEFDFDWLDDAIALIASAGMKVILGTPTNCPPLWLYQDHPETLQCERDGRRTWTGIRGHRCQNSPTFRKYAERIVRELANRYAGRPELLAWQIDNEVEDSHCTCPECTKKFQEFVKSRHHTLDELNHAWGTEVWSNEYSSWNQVKPFVTSPNNRSDWMNPAYMLDYERFCSKTTAVYVKFQADIIRSVDPRATITTNACFGSHIQDFYDEFASLDVASYDNYPPLKIPSDPEELYSNGFALDFVRGWKGKNFWVMEQLGGPMGCWMPITRAMEPGMLEGYALQAVAHGADLLSFFRWRTATAGAEMFCYGLMDHNNRRNRRIEELKHLVKRLRDLPGLLDTAVHSDVALVYSSDTEHALQTQFQSDGYAYWTQLRLYQEACSALGVNVDVIRDDAPLDGYKVAIVASYQVCDPEFVRRLQKFVDQGGVAVVTARSGVKDKNGNCVLGEDLPTAFRPICGCHVLESDAIGPDRQQVKDGSGRLYEITSWCDLLECEGAQPIAAYVGRYYDGVPAVTRNCFGKGFAYYVGTVGQKSFARNVVAQALRDGGVRYLDSLPDGMESCVRSGEGGTYRFFFNNTLERRTLMFEGTELSFDPLQVRIIDAEGSWH